MLFRLQLLTNWNVFSATLHRTMKPWQAHTRNVMCHIGQLLIIISKHCISFTTENLLRVTVCSMNSQKQPIYRECSGIKWAPFLLYGWACVILWNSTLVIVLTQKASQLGQERDGDHAGLEPLAHSLPPPPLFQLLCIHPPHHPPGITKF